MTTIQLPRVAGSRDLAENLVKEADLTPNGDVSVDARAMVVNTESFAFRFAELIADLKPAHFVLIGGSPTWHKDLAAAAEKFHLQLQVRGAVVAD